MDFIVFTHAEAETGPYYNTAGATFRNKNGTEEKCGQFVTTYVDKCIVHLQLLLGVTLSEMAHIVWKYCEVIGHLMLLAEIHYDG